MLGKYFKFIILIFIIVFLSCRKTGNNPDIYFCDAEKISADGKFFTDKKNPEIKFGNAQTQSFEKVYEGKYSVKLDSVNKYGMSIKIKNINPGEYYKLSVFRYGNPDAYLIASAGKNYYNKFGDKNLKPTKKNGWYKIETIIQIPFNIKSKELNIYVWNTNGETAYFDNLKIERLKKENYKFKQAALYLYIDEPEMQKLESIRQKAFRKGILETTDDSWVKGSMFYKGEDYKIKLRFKGDWLDHLEGSKWSFRIKVKKNKAWKGIKTFSVQNPKSRHFLDEYIAHKIAEKEDILTTRYDFIPVYLNGNPLGIYAYEEHFEKQLVESKKRREGVILKFSEDQFWATYKTCGTTDTMPVYEASDIIPFKLNKTLKNKTLFKQFLIAQNLLYEYKYQLKKASKIFDTKKLAKFYALTTLTKMNHSLRWHNMRFYYNPVLSKLEPVLYDGYTTDGYMAWGGNIFGNFEITEAEKTKIENRANYYVFTDSAFRNAYLKQLEIYASDTFLTNFFTKNNQKIHFYEKELQKEFINYQYDSTFLFKNAKKIRKDLNIYKLRIKEGKFDTLIFTTNDKKRYTGKIYENLIPDFINAFTEQKNENSIKIKVESYLPYPFKIIGFAETDLFVSEKTHPLNFKKYEQKEIEIKNPSVKYICVKTEKSGKISFIKIFPFPAPLATSPLQKLLSENNNPELKKNIIVFKKGSYSLNKTLIIPEGKKVIFEAGAKLDLIDNAGFISYSPVYMKGTFEDKITINSSDGTGQGFTVLQAKEKSEFSNVIFSNLNTLSYNGWTLSGAVTVYESEIIINDCEFKNNKCEDALNIVRSNFDVTNCKFTNIFSDAFDSDFCTGNLSNTNFENIGNDAIDFSTSVIDILNCNINDAKDKAVSGGEASHLTIKNCKIDGANIGIASKDKSVVKVTDTSIKNVTYVLTAFQKKPEYGAAKIFAENLKTSDYKKMSLIEKHSVLTLDGLLIKGQEKNVAKKFY